MKFYLFTHSPNVESSIRRGLFYLAKKDKSVDLDLANYDGDIMTFNVIFNSNYQCEFITFAQYERALNNLDDKEKLIEILVKEDKENKEIRTEGGTDDKEDEHNRQCKKAS